MLSRSCARLSAFPFILDSINQLAFGASGVFLDMLATEMSKSWQRLLITHEIQRIHVSFINTFWQIASQAANDASNSQNAPIILLLFGFNCIGRCWSTQVNVVAVDHNLFL